MIRIPINQSVEWNVIRVLNVAQLLEQNQVDAVTILDPRLHFGIKNCLWSKLSPRWSLFLWPEISWGCRASFQESHRYFPGL